MIRAVELILGISVPGAQFSSNVHTSNFTSALAAAANDNASPGDIFTSEVRSVLLDAVPILVEMGFELAIGSIFNFNLATARSQREPLVTK